MFLLYITFVLIGDSDGLILNSDGVSLHRFDGPLEAPSPHLRCLSVHWVVDGGPSSRAFSDGFLLISILLNSATCCVLENHIEYEN